jgi:hypothetical protein
MRRALGTESARRRALPTATRYVFCVNVDAVIAALLLAVLWKDYRSGAMTEKNLETAAFNVFLYGRMIGAAAEIDDHLNRGREAARCRWPTHRESRRSVDQFAISSSLTS